MSLYVIARKNEEYLDTPVFHAGDDDREEAIAVFTNGRLAEEYIADADWSAEYEVGELQPIQLLRWFTTAHQEGTDLAVVNPERASQLSGERQRVVDLNEPLEAFADTLRVRLLDAGSREQAT